MHDSSRLGKPYDKENQLTGDKLESFQASIGTGGRALFQIKRFVKKKIPLYIAHDSPV